MNSKVNGDMTIHIFDEDIAACLEITTLKKAVDPKQLGKYLFFASDQDRLFKLMLDLWEGYGLVYFEMSNKASNGAAGFNYVLKAYDVSNNYSLLIPEHINLMHVNYRYWKTEQASRNKLYSREYLIDSL